MTPLNFTLITFCASVFAGFLGSLLGLGGGVIITPVLTLFLGVDIKYAIGASIISVIATSSGSAAAYVKEHMTNLRVAMLLEVGTTTGALTGAYLAGILNPRYLFIIFGVILAYSALTMLRKRHEEDSAVPPCRMADMLRLLIIISIRREQREIYYRVTRTPLGLFSYVHRGRRFGFTGDLGRVAQSTGARFGDGVCQLKFRQPRATL